MEFNHAINYVNKIKVGGVSELRERGRGEGGSEGGREGGGKVGVREGGREGGRWE